MLYRYRLFTRDGDEDGEAHYAVPINPGEPIHTDDGRKLRVLDVIPLEAEGAALVGLLTVAPA